MPHKKIRLGVPNLDRFIKLAAEVNKVRDNAALNLRNTLLPRA
jgi:hypothetical protein